MRPGRQCLAGPNQGNGFPLNNQRNNNNNRRRGRGNNRGGNSGGGNQGNRIDNRARGNAPQMLEKYRKLAQEAQLNDDRVQTEYYLQFADHYFRVIADGRATKDDGRPQQGRDQNGYDGDDDGDDDDDDRDEQQQGESRRDEPRRDEPRRDEGRNRQQQPRRNDASDDDGEDRSEDRGESENRSAQREPRPERRPRKDARSDQQAGPRADAPPAEAVFEVRAGAEGDEDEGDNPFSGKPRRKTRARKPADVDAGDNGDAGFNPSLLPPSIARSKSEPREDAPAPRGDDASDDGAEKPRRRLKMPRARSGDEEELAAVD